MASWLCPVWCRDFRECQSDTNDTTSRILQRNTSLSASRSLGLDGQCHYLLPSARLAVQYFVQRRKTRGKQPRQTYSHATIVLSGHLSGDRLRSWSLPHHAFAKSRATAHRSVLSKVWHRLPTVRLLSVQRNRPKKPTLTDLTASAQSDLSSPALVLWLGLALCCYSLSHRADESYLLEARLG